jgi:hypothetical protein
VILRNRLRGCYTVVIDARDELRISRLRVRTVYIKEDFQRVDSNQLRVYSVRKYVFNLESCAPIKKDPGKFAELLNG